MELWMPGATRLNASGGGTLVKGPPRCTWHITYDALNPRPTFMGVMQYLISKRYEPHLGWDPLTGKIVQFLPANQSARALENHAGGVETNRLGDVHIQIEAFFTPGMTINGKTYAQLTDTPMVGLPEILAWLDSLGIPRQWANPKKDRDVAIWQHVAGHRAHYNVPENTHTDIAGADTRRLLMFDRPTPPPSPTPTPGDFMIDKPTADAIRAIIQDELRTVLGQRTPDKKDTDPAHISLSDLYTQQETFQDDVSKKLADLADQVATFVANQPGAQS